MKFFLRLTVMCLALAVSPAAFAEHFSGPDMEHCADDSSLAPEQIISSCTTFMTEAEQQSWGTQHVPTALYYQARAYRRAGEASKAKTDLVRAVKMAPEYYDAWRLLVVLMNVPESEADMKVVDVMIAANPQNADVLNSACWVRAEKGEQLDSAISDCNMAIAFDIKNPEFMNTRCFAEFRNANFSAASADCEAALKLDPKLASVLYVRGVLKLKAGDAAGGKQDIADAETIKPKIAEEYAGYGVKP